MSTAHFKGFGDWVEIFKVGTHKDGNGNVRTWTDADLDEIVANHNAADPAPLVIGHPKNDSPSYGWSAELKRGGELLLAKFSKVHEAVDKAAQSGAYRNRSIKVAKSDKGWKLIHVGLLGAAPPAVEGLAPVYNADDAGDTYEFGGWQEAYKTSALARIARRFREFIIGSSGQEEADRVIPSYEIDELERIAADERAQDAKKLNPAFAANPQEQDMPFSQAQLDEAVAKAREEERAAAQAASATAQQQLKQLEFSQRLTDNKAFVSTLMSDDAGKVRLLPAEVDGWAEALTFAQGLEAAEFTFSAEGGAEQKPTLYEFLKAKLGALTPRLTLGQEQVPNDTNIRIDTSNSAEIQKAAAEFVAAEAKEGREVSIAQAVNHVVNKHGRAAA